MKGAAGEKSLERFPAEPLRESILDTFISKDKFISLRTMGGYS